MKKKNPYANLSPKPITAPNKNSIAQKNPNVTRSVSDIDLRARANKR